MKSFAPVRLVVIVHALLCVALPLSATGPQSVLPDPTTSSAVPLWRSSKAEHVYGLPDIKPHKKGTLVLSEGSLTFTSGALDASIPRSSVTAVSAGNQRVEMWGVGGRILRMTIPDGGGLAAAAFMHHRVDMLTVEFNDNHGSKRGAVFFLPAKEADRALQSFALTPFTAHKASDGECQSSVVAPGSVLVSAPEWGDSAVPAAYRSLVYEHVVDRLRLVKGVGHVYRDGEATAQDACPQYVVHLLATAFKPGSSVKRAALGPVGFFVGTTQVKFDVTFSEASGPLKVEQQITATMRGESESTSVADHLAKNIAKRYAAVLKDASKSAPAKRTS